MVTLAAAEDADAEAGAATFQISIPRGVDQFVEAVELDDDIGANLALASGGSKISGGSLSAKAIDGIHQLNSNYAYLITTNVPPPVWTLDLRSAQAIARVRLLNWDWDVRVHRYTLESSTDGVNWTMLVDASGEDRRGWDDWAVDVTARYLRLQGLSNSLNAVFAIPEWEVYGPAPAAKRGRLTTSLPSKAPAVQPPAARIEVDLDVAEQMPLIWPVTVVTSDGGPEDPAGWAAVDGDPETGWTGREGAGGWYIAIGYGDTVAASHLVVDVADGSAMGMQCLISLDGDEWTEWAEDALEEPRTFNYLWLLFTADAGGAAVPQVMEIHLEP